MQTVWNGIAAARPYQRPSVNPYAAFILWSWKFMSASFSGCPILRGWFGCAHDDCLIQGFRLCISAHSVLLREKPKRTRMKRMTPMVTDTNIEKESSWKKPVFLSRSSMHDVWMSFRSAASAFHPRSSVADKNLRISNFWKLPIRINPCENSASSAPLRENKIKNAFRLLLRLRRRFAPRNDSLGWISNI